jgi:hypothetical protein
MFAGIGRNLALNGVISGGGGLIFTGAGTDRLTMPATAIQARRL